MRTLPLVVFVVALLVSVALAQEQQPTAEVHCELDQTKADQDAILVEGKCLSQLHGLATRSGDELRLTFEDGKTRTFTDQSRACEQQIVEKCRLHHLVAYYPALNLFVIERAAYESSDAIVVSRRSGSITRMDVQPHLSPSGKRMVAAAAIEAWDVEKEIAIYAVQMNSLKLEWSYKASEYEMWNFVAWDGDERIKLRVTLWTVDRSGTRVLATQNAEVQRTILGWQLNKNIGP